MNRDVIIKNIDDLVRELRWFYKLPKSRNNSCHKPKR